MPVQNAEIATMLNHLADLLEIEGENPFRIRAYRNAARTAEETPKSLAGMLEEGADLTELPGIGDSIALKIKEYVDTGHLHKLEEEEKKIPGQLSQLMELPGLGPKRVKSLYEKLGIATLEDLQAAVDAGKIHQLAGFGEKTEQHIREELERIAQTGKRILLFQAQLIADPLLAYIRQIPGVKQAIVAGSYRRRKETVGDLDILVTSSHPQRLMDRVVAYDDVAVVMSQGETRATVRLKNEFQVDVRVVSPESYGAALYYFTGSKSHNIAVRTLAQKQGLKINEYGVFKDNIFVAGKTEKEVLAQVGLPYIEPELRENNGEIEAALAHHLPRLVTLEDIRGDLHSHTKATDGKNTVMEMAEAAMALGYEYLSISDHTQNTRVAGGLTAKEFAAHLKAIEQVNGQISGIRLLKSAEVDILQDGSLDLPEWILREMDVVVCSIHSQFNLPNQKQTERIIRAMDHPYCHILGHPTGRLIMRRKPYDIDLERIMVAARERGCFLEVNAQPSRLDLSDVYCRLAKDIGVKLVISSDAHSTVQLGHLHFGVDQARRGWVEKNDVANTRSWRAFARMMRHD